MTIKESDVSEGVEHWLREEIAGWEQAYPLSAFPEPDLVRAAAVLKAEGMTLDAISASNMRHVVSRLAPNIHEAAGEIERLKAEIATLSPPLPSPGVERLREALEQWKCPSCGGSKVYTQRWRDETAALQSSEVPCKVCEESGLHPIAHAALSALPLDGGLK